MAQAARLNLRMQKELKLLLTDPPPGASFPSLSDEASAPSLTSIDALFRGPEGTVYANGVFKINIQIPERYPFQPPIVTFATPIYHPNIDNGGRICLDILNLPPKGTWQPSLNISTVLTSIGLLLSEPNPDDGLMHEASREYKYNRQAFDQKARSMTEKYARAGESQIQTGQSTAHTEMKESDASIFALGSSSNSISGLGKVPINNFSKKLVHIGQIETSNNISTEHKGNPGKLHARRSKLSLKAVAPHIRTGENTNLDLPNRSSMLETITNKDYIDTTVTKEQETSHCVKTGQSGNADKQHIPKGSILSSSRLEKVGLVGSIPSPEHLEDEKENRAPIPHSSSRISSALSENCKYSDGRKEKKAAISRLKLSDMADNPPLKPVEQLPSSTNEESPISESVIVLDSEDSEDENIPVRSKLSLAKRCLSRKRKSGFRQVNTSSCNSSSNSMS